MADNTVLEKLKAQAAAELNTVKTLRAEYAGKEAEMPKEIADGITARLGKFDLLKLQIAETERVLDAEEYLESPAGTKAAHLGWREAGPGEGDAPIDEKSWREVEVPVMKIAPSGLSYMDTKTFRFHVPLGVQGKDYPVAYEAYLRKGWDDLGFNDKKLLMDARRSGKTLTEGVDSAGGFLVPPDFHVEVIKKIATMSTVRPNARVVGTSRDVAQWPKVTYTDNDEYTSGVRVTWSGAEIPAASTSHGVTEPVFGMYNIPVNTAMASMPVSLSLIEDSAFDVMAVASELFAEAFALGENDRFWLGSGAAEPRGILTSAIGSTADADHIEVITAATAETFTANELIDVAWALPAQYERNAKWYFTKATEKVIRQFQDTDGNYLYPVWPQVGNLGVVQREIFGFPTIRDEAISEIPSTSSAADSVPIIFGDLNGYLVLDRVGLSLQRVTEPYILQNYIVLFGRKRVGGQTIEPWRMRGLLVKSTT